MKIPRIVLPAFAMLLHSWVHAADSRPNIVLILGEAQGWASMSEPLDDRNVAASKSSFIQTPNLDHIAREGTRFSDFYAASPRCTPTRAALATGRSPAFLHMTFVNEGRRDGMAMPGDKVIAPQASTELPQNIETMATVLRRAGYATAHFGKWHLGRANPRIHGFEENDGANDNGGPDNVESPNPKQCFAIAKLATEFVSRQAQAHHPFFLQISEYPDRGLETARPETVEAVKRRLATRVDFQRISQAAGAEDIDSTIGQLLAKLQELNLLGNTYVIYTADHGSQGRKANGGLTQGKGTVWEGGLRVPLLVMGPGVLAGAFSHIRASTVDLLPTVAELAGVTPDAWPQGLEGGSLAAILKHGDNAPVKRAREELVVHFPHYDKDELGPASAVFVTSYKLIRYYASGDRHLFDLSKDLAEDHDLAGSLPELTHRLDQRLTEYLSLVKADLPIPNPNYDPNGAKSGDRQNDGKKGNKKMRKDDTKAQPGN